MARALQASRKTFILAGLLCGELVNVLKPSCVVYFTHFLVGGFVFFNLVRLQELPFKKFNKLDHLNSISKAVLSSHSKKFKV